MTEEESNRAAGRPRDQKTDEAILQAGLELLIEIGVDETSFEKIAKRAGTTRATIYRRYDTKAELFVDAIGTFLSRMEGVFGDWQSKSLEEVLALFTDEASIKGMLSQTRFLARLIGSVVDHPEIMGAYQKHYGKPRREAFKRVLERAKAEGKLKADADLDVIVDIISGGVLASILTSVPPPTESELADRIDRLFRFLFPNLKSL